ncbi:MAG: hypothetical protein M9964_12025 [Solirubrobacterales bacterium]|nr:hypothetical protein [Solirubrobacterales bacterium]
MRRIILITGLALAALVAGPASAGAETLFDHVDETPPQSTLSQEFPSGAALDSLAADDFAVPAGETWTLESAQIQGTAVGPVTTDQWNVTVYGDGGGLPGPQLFTGTLTVGGFPNPAIPLSSVPTLNPGTYWLAVQAIMDDGPGLADAHRWFWSENDEQSGSRAAFQNPGGGLSTCSTFGTRSTCLGSHPSPDQSFRLSGTRTVTPPPSGDDSACTAAKAALEKAKGKLKAAKEKAKKAKGKAKKKAAQKVKKAKDKVKKAQAAATEACS